MRFSGCTSLKNVAIPAGVEVIEQYTFSGCLGLTSVTISSGVKAIMEEAFERCTSLKSVTIPNSVTSIGKRALGYNWDTREDTYPPIAGFTIFSYNGSAAHLC